jgi:hypothetical protein
MRHDNDTDGQADEISSSGDHDKRENHDVVFAFVLREAGSRNSRANEDVQPTYPGKTTEQE